MQLPFALPVALAALFFVLAAVPCFIWDEYAEVAITLSNLAYALPLTISYYANNFDFVLTILICALISFFYHSCKAWDICFRLDEPAWESIDVTYSWFLLLTLVSYFALERRFLHVMPFHVALIVWGSHAHCTEDNYDCRSYKSMIVGLYFIYIVYQGIRKPKVYDFIDIGIAMVFFAGATTVYLFFNTLSGHSLWHILSAIGICFVLTCYRTAPFHTLGFRANNIAYQNILVRADI